MQKKSSAMLQFIVLYSDNGEQDPLFITNYAIINVLDAISRTPGRRPGQPVRETELLDADLVRYAAADQPQSGAVRRDRRDPRPERAGAGRPHRRAADQRRPAVPVQRADAGQADHPGRSSATSCCAPIRTARCCGSSDVARVEIGAQNLDSESRIDGRAGVPIGIYLAPGANAVTTAKAVQATLQKLSERFPPGLTYLVQYDSTTFVTRHHHGGAEDAGRSLRARRDRGVPVPRQFARHHHSGGCGSGQPDRRLRGAAGARLFGQHGIAARDGARDRHRGR